VSQSHHLPPPAPQPSPPEAPTEPGRPWPPLPDGWWRRTAPGATFPVPFTIGDGFALFAWSIVGQFVLGVPTAWLLAAVGIDASQPGSGRLVLVIAVFTGVLLTSLLYLGVRGRLGWQLLGPIRPRVSHVWWGLLSGIVGLLAIQVSIGLLLQALGETDVPEQELLAEARGGGDTLLLVLSVVVLAPLVEEVIFRGVLFQALRRRLGLWSGAIISSLAFGFIHVEVIGVEALPAALVAVVLLCLAVVPRFPLVARVVLGVTGLGALVFAVSLGGYAAVLLPLSLALLGLLFAWAFHRTGGLLVPIVGHAVFNGIVIGLTIATRDLELPV
jgi:uncharacterized protein